MAKPRDFFRSGNVMPLALVASAFIGFTALISVLMLPASITPDTQMRLEPLSGTIKEGDIFTVEVVVDTQTAANVFAGELIYDTEFFAIDSIDYNTSIADLWAEEPWYNRGENIIHFAGGTTRRGGFIGEGTLITVHFRSIAEGSGTLAISNPQILLHDGLGTLAEVGTPIDAIFTVENPLPNKITSQSTGSSIRVVEELPSTDLNGDGKQNIVDVSIFMLNIAGSDPRYDFNQDGKVNTIDLNILLGSS